MNIESVSSAQKFTFWFEFRVDQANKSHTDKPRNQLLTQPNRLPTAQRRLEIAGNIFDCVRQHNY